MQLELTWAAGWFQGEIKGFGLNEELVIHSDLKGRMNPIHVIPRPCYSHKAKILSEIVFPL